MSNRTELVRRSLASFVYYLRSASHSSWSPCTGKGSFGEVYKGYVLWLRHLSP